MLRAWIKSIDTAGALILLVSLIGLALRIEHAATFDGHNRGSDYDAHVAGIRWMSRHWRAFDFSNDIGAAHNWSIGYQPPLWYALGAVILGALHNERAVAFVAVAGWCVRQLVLARILSQSAHHRRWSAVAALTLNAFLPISVLTDGKVNPEGLHSTLFTIALYWLRRIEREATKPSGIPLRTAAAFGAFAALAVLTKATASVLPLSAMVLLLGRAAFSSRRTGWGLAWRRLLRPALLAGAVWCAVAGWWVGPNLVKYHHPFPHSWDRDTPASVPILAKPFYKRRPVKWLLPFTWRPYLAAPVIRNPTEPTPNLWAVLVTGTWSDFYNRGFCRLKGPEVPVSFWGMPVTGRCLRLFSALASIGSLLALLAVFSVGYTAWSYLSTSGREGSMALPLTIALAVIFCAAFALVYPYDDAAVLNPRYLLPESTALCACIGMTLARWEARRWRPRLLTALVFIATALVMVLVIWERLGR